MMPEPKRSDPLITSVSQYDVDFVIPRVGIDLPLGIDPFLMFKSRDEGLRRLHTVLVGHFNLGIEAVKRGQLERAESHLDFPEVSAIGLGYATSGKRGSGLGTFLTSLIIETLRASPGIQERGVRHVEEMQLLCAGIGPDRVSDIAANVLKRSLIEYTQQQASIWGIPLKPRVPMPHVYDELTQTWEDVFEDLPVSPFDETPLLLVPRRIVRVLPWINYDDFVQRDFRAFMEDRRVKTSGAKISGVRSGNVSKTIVADTTRTDVSIIDRYVRNREEHAAEAVPSLEYLDEEASVRAATLIDRLSNTPTGREAAKDYQYLVLEILNFLFSPELIDGKPEVRTVDGTERRDIIFTNDSDESFWDYVRSTHDSLVLMFEIKNTDSLDSAAIAQTATYLGDRLGRLGFIVTRNLPSPAMMKKTFSVWNDSGVQKKVILIIDDGQLIDLMKMRAADKSPTPWVQNHYRNFRTSAQ